MQKRSLQDSITMLKSVRHMYHSQLDISIVAELDAVIAELEIADSDLNRKRNQSLGLRALQILGVVISIVSNIKDFIK